MMGMDELVDCLRIKNRINKMNYDSYTFKNEYNIWIYEIHNRHYTWIRFSYHLTNYQLKKEIQFIKY